MALSYERIQRASLEIIEEAAADEGGDQWDSIEIEEATAAEATAPDDRWDSWIPTPEMKRRCGKKKKRCWKIKFLWSSVFLISLVFLVALYTIAKTVPSHHHHHHHYHPLPVVDYRIALSKALVFFNAQRSGKLPAGNNVSWRGDSCLKDGYDNHIVRNEDLVGGYYDGGDSIKFHFPGSFAITTLSWSVIEYSSKYEVAGELEHVKDVIRWGTDYLLKCFASTANTIDIIVAQVGRGRNCWMRPEDIDSVRSVSGCTHCSDLAAEMAAALASASIVFKNDSAYSKRLVHGARVLFEFAKSRPGRYSVGSDAELFYNSTSYWDEYIWGATWLYYATGESSYLSFATDPEMAKRAGAFSRAPDFGVFSWDNKLVGSQVLLTRDIRTRRTKAGLIQLNHGGPRPLQYVVNAVFLATLYSDYLVESNAPGWYCGPTFYTVDVLRRFAETQMQYILGENPMNISYVVGFGDRYPTHVHHRGASIPLDNVTYSCEEGKKWRDSPDQNPNTIIGALVGGPDKFDSFHDVRGDYNHTEPTLAGNAGLVAALVALSGEKTVGIDHKTIFSRIPPMYPM